MVDNLESEQGILGNENLIKWIFPDGNTIQWEYDDKGNQVKEIFSNGHVNKFEYFHDKNGMLTMIRKNNKTILEVCHIRNTGELIGLYEHY